MKKLLMTSLACGLLAAGNITLAQEPPAMPETPAMPTPSAEHEWLQRFAGKWESEAEIYMMPDAPPLQVRSVETFRSVGPFWVAGTVESILPEMPFTGAYILGFDPASKRFVGNWVDSMKTEVTQVSGKKESDGTLVMEFEGPCPMRQGQLTHFCEVTRFIDDDHRETVTSLLDENGEWVVNMRSKSRRMETKAQHSTEGK